MGWKNVKQHYRIGHIVAIHGEKGICIGSPYIHDIISIPANGMPKWGNLGPSSNGELARYWSEMMADIPKLKALIDAPDSFDKAHRVFTYDDGGILEKLCEEYGYPNVTHDGCVMYENTYFKSRAEAVAVAKSNARYWVKGAARRVKQVKAELKDARAYLAEAKAARAKLMGPAQAVELEGRK